MTGRVTSTVVESLSPIAEKTPKIARRGVPARSKSPDFTYTVTEIPMFRRYP